MLALDTGVSDGRREESAAEEGYEDARPSGLVWDLPDSYVLRNSDRVVLAATRRGLADLLGAAPPDPAVGLNGLVLKRRTGWIFSPSGV